MMLRINGQPVGVVTKIDATPTEQGNFIIPPIITFIITDPSMIAIIIKKMEGQDPETGVVDL